jgi:hypothetical protein
MLEKNFIWEEKEIKFSINAMKSFTQKIFDKNIMIQIPLNLSFTFTILSDQKNTLKLFSEAISLLNSVKIIK